MKINRMKTVQVNATTLRVHLKVCDRFTADLSADDGEVIKDYEGYVPEFMPGEHYGDYVILDIDLDTGMIRNWKAPSAEQIEAFIASED